MRKYVVLHGAKESLSWGNYLVNKLDGNVYLLECPKGARAKYNEWEKVLNELYNNEVLDENCIVIAHSDGASFMVKYLLERKCKVNAFISVAATVNSKEEFNVSDKERKDFASLVKYRYSVYSNMDKVCTEKELEKFAMDIKASRSVIGFGGHFDSKSKVEEVPYIVDIIKEIIVKDRKARGRIVYVGIENKASEAAIKKYKEVKEYLSTKFRYVTTPLTSIEHVGKEVHKFKRYTDLIRNSEVVVIDVHPDSLEVGVEMMMAISMKIPTLVVAKSSIVVPDIVTCAYGEKNIRRYRNTEDLINIVEEYLNA